MTDSTTLRRKRVVLCRGQYCNLSRRADKLYKKLETLVDAANDDQYPKPIKLETANCLSMCGAGPNLIVYPDQAVYNAVTEDLLDSIAEQHFTPVNEAE